MGGKEIVVLLPVYQAQRDLERSLRALVGSGDIADVLVVDDGSNPAIHIPDSIRTRIPVALLRRERNGGIVAALNEGLGYILQRGYTYIARLDAGDISHPARLQRQSEYLREHPGCMLVGSHVAYRDAEGRLLAEIRPPDSAADLKRAVYSQQCFVHPATMFRAEVFRAVGLYSCSYPGCEDQDLFYRIAERFELGMVPERLLDYIVSDQSLSARQGGRQRWSRIQVHLRYRQPGCAAWYSGLAKALVCLVLPRNTVLAVRRAIRKGRLETP
jgi:glycosyltransferase involved in cell wall biosynthesis